MTIFESVLELIGNRPDLKKVLKRIVEYEEAHRFDEYFETLGWTWDDLDPPASPQILYRLFLKGILKRPYKSRSHKGYLLANRDEVKRALEWFEVSNQTAAFNEELEVPTDLFDVIVGFEDIKTVIKKSLKADKPVHVLLVGPPSTAKSLFLMELSRFPHSRYAIGGRSSKAGMSRFLIETRPRFLLIDEIEKMQMKDYSVLISLMETGVISELLAGRTQTVKLKTWVFATANDQSKLPPELRSRFIRFNLDEYTSEQFREVAVKTLIKREGLSSYLAEYIAEKLMFKTRDVREAVRIGRLCKSERQVDEVLEVMLCYGSFT
jgi:Holliday junction DNA helicase RuvB